MKNSKEEQILKLRAEGKKIREISEITGFPMGTVYHYVGKEKHRQIAERKAAKKEKAELKKQGLGQRRSNESEEKKHFTVQDLAALWNLSTDYIRFLFRKEPGVIVLEEKKPGKRKYTTLRIPASVAERVARRYTVPKISDEAALSYKPKEPAHPIPEGVADCFGKFRDPDTVECQMCTEFTNCGVVMKAALRHPRTGPDVTSIAAAPSSAFESASPTYNHINQLMSMVMFDICKKEAGWEIIAIDTAKKRMILSVPTE